MALTSAQQVRLKIQDQPLIADVTLLGDGISTAFVLEQRNLSSGTAFVQSGAAWSATGATFSSGTLALANVVSANSGIRARYVYSMFSDDEIDHFLSAGGSVAGAALEAVEALMFDGLRRANWTAPDGTRYDDTAAMAMLRDLHKILEDELGEEATAGGSIESWSLNQGLY